MSAGPAIPTDDATAGAAIVRVREISEWQLIERNRRYSIITAVEELKAEPHKMSERRACELAAVDNATYGRWRKKFRAHGIDGLIPGASTGRPSQWRDFLSCAAVCTKLDTIYCATIGASSEGMTDARRTAKIATTLYRFAEEPECPALLGEQLRRGSQPTPIVRYLRRITTEIEARIRGNKHLQLHGFDSRRDLTVRLPDGQRAEMLAGFMIELDDMSANQPFWCACARPQGEGEFEPTILSRQGLYARDVKTGRWLGVELIARPREAYRAEDILRFLRRLMMLFGKFDVLRLERGIWAARSIKGLKITNTGALVEEEIERPAMDPAQRTELARGLEAIGITIQYVTSPHKKGGIESGFNYLQTVLATYTTDFVNIGRHAGEFEIAAKRMRQARAESHHPRDLRFAHIEELAERIEKTFAFINRKPRSSRTSKAECRTPDDDWSADIARRALPPLTERDLAAFLPVVRERSIDGGRCVVKIDGAFHDFRSDAFAQLGAGYKIFLRFDPTEPTLGAAIYNRDTSSANHVGYAEGEFICFARWECPGPQIDLAEARGLTPVPLESLYGAGVQDDGYERRKTQEKFVRTVFRGLPKVGRPAVKHSEVRQGNGDLTSVGRDSVEPSKVEKSNAGAPEPSTFGVRPSTPSSDAPAPAPDAWAKQQERLKRQAEQANRLRALTGQD